MIIISHLLERESPAFAFSFFVFSIKKKHKYLLFLQKFVIMHDNKLFFCNFAVLTKPMQ